MRINKWWKKKWKEGSVLEPGQRKQVAAPNSLYRRHHSRGLNTRRGGPAVTLDMKLTPLTKLAPDTEDPALKGVSR